jgi:MTH538 TIR-like domain (DUF1863)
MPRRTFFSFHYKPDVWRAWNVRNTWVVPEGDEDAGFFDGSVFEASQRKGDEALKRFLREGMKNTSVTCVLAGAATYSRRWVRYEIVRSVLKGNGLLTVHIYGVGDHSGNTSAKGPDPLGHVGLYKAGGQIWFAETRGDKWVKYEDYSLAVSAADLWFAAPTDNTVVPLSKHCMAYDFTVQNGRKNIGGWIEAAAGLADC